MRFYFPAVSNRPMMKFEGGYTVETVFDGTKLGIEPYSVAASPNGELLVLDSENSNIYKISTPLSRCKISAPTVLELCTIRLFVLLCFWFTYF